MLDIFINHELAPCITRPTRVTHNTATLIDNIYLRANYCNNCSSGRIFISDISDHYPVFTCVRCSKDPVSNGPLSFKHRTFGESDCNQLCLLLDEVYWDFVETLDLNEAYNEFFSIIKEYLDFVAPEKNCYDIAT